MKTGFMRMYQLDEKEGPTTLTAIAATNESSTKPRSSQVKTRYYKVKREII
jgi:hypothetical protein